MIQLIQHIIAVVIFLLIATILSVILFWLNTDKIGKKPYLIIGMFALGGATVSMVFSFLLLKNVFSSFEIAYLLIQLIAIFAGSIFMNILYSQIWARRSTLSWSEDSILPELAYTLIAGHIYAIFSIGLFWAISPDRTQEAISLWSLFIPFLLPFVCSKTYDLFSQIPARDFKFKWKYTLHPLNENTWRNELGMTFIVAESLEHEDRFMASKARIFVRAPRRDWNLGDIFRIALKHYHENAPSIEVYDVGDDITEDFWWLFVYQFSLFRPKSWFPGTRYLDPNSSIEDNGIRLNSVIRVKRILGSVRMT